MFKSERSSKYAVLALMTFFAVSLVPLRQGSKTGVKSIDNKTGVKSIDNSI
jgi:hypothetical protein